MLYSPLEYLIVVTENMLLRLSFLHIWETYFSFVPFTYETRILTIYETKIPFMNLNQANSEMLRMEGILAGSRPLFYR